MLLSGAQLWIGFKTWYYSVYFQPWEGEQDAITRLIDRWQDRAKLLALSWLFRRGLVPKCGLATLWALTCDLVCARTLPASRQAALLFPWAKLWDACSYDGQVSLGSVSIAVERGAVEKAAVLQAWTKEFPQLHARSVVTVLDKMGAQSLPAVAFAMHRCCQLNNWEEALPHIIEFSKAIIDVIAKHVQHLASLCTLDLPVGAPERELYRSGRRKAHRDPRAQALFVTLPYLFLAQSHRQNIFPGCMMLSLPSNSPGPKTKQQKQVHIKLLRAAREPNGNE